MSSTKPNMSNDQLNNIAQFLLQGQSNGKPAVGRITEAAAKFGVSRKHVSSIWKRAKQQISEGKPISLSNRKAGRNMTKWKILVDHDFLKTVPLSQRGTIRRVASVLGVGKSTVGEWVKNGQIKDHTNAIHPELTEKNRTDRLKFSLKAVYFDRILNVVKFKSMQQVIHIDEKWFNLSRTTERYYLSPEEADPYRSCKSKRFITKVTFLCAVARPIYARDGQLIFDGKIGIFPFINKVPAKRKSKNRPVGTLETKSMDSITKEVTKHVLINQVIPAIRALWPTEASKDIIIQQDNTRPHIKDDDHDFRQAATMYGFNMSIVFQPPNSPDTNVLDLGFFRAIQSLQVETVARNVDELLTAVDSSFKTLSHVALNKVFLTLQGVMVEIMKVRGHNNYTVPHMKKDALMRLNILPTDLEVEINLVRNCIEDLIEGGEAEGLGELIGSLGYI
ncbi:hypothetical protein OROHE_006926 [Orobanche hederae]